MALDPDVDEVPVEAHGDTWVVRVLGRAQGGHGGARTPLLLLGFWPDDSTEGPPIREALVVGSLLSAQDQSRLTEALEHSVPHRNRGSESAFFEEAHERRGR